MLKRIWWFSFFSAALIIKVLPPAVWASEGLDIPEPLDHKVVLDGLSGISLFFAKTYNENLLHYAIICTVLMAAVGIIIAFVTDVLLKMIGMETEKIEHKE